MGVIIVSLKWVNCGLVPQRVQTPKMITVRVVINGTFWGNMGWGCESDIKIPGVVIVHIKG